MKNQFVDLHNEVGQILLRCGLNDLQVQESIHFIDNAIGEQDIEDFIVMDNLPNELIDFLEVFLITRQKNFLDIEIKRGKPDIYLIAPLRNIVRISLESYDMLLEPKLSKYVFHLIDKTIFWMIVPKHKKPLAEQFIGKVQIRLGEL